MSKREHKMQSWQVFHFARKRLGNSVLYALFGRKNARAIDRWCEDPLYTAKTDNAYDPIKGIKNLIDSLDDNGHCSTVRSLLAYLASGTSCDAGDVPALVDLLPTVSEEILADFRSVGELQRSIEAGDDIEVVEALKKKAIDDLDRTVARYREDMK